MGVVYVIYGFEDKKILYIDKTMTYVPGPREYDHIRDSKSPGGSAKVIFDC